MSLLLNSDFNFRLIGNGLDPSEEQLLKEISLVSDRLEYINMHSGNIIPHGTLVDLMFLAENEELFCFCDSDLFMFEPIKASSILTKMQTFQVFSSGGRIENEDETTYAGFKGGATTISPDGHIDLATSFFCVYQRKSLQAALDKYGVGFEQYRLDEQIPAAAMSVVEDLQLSYEMFDTGKLLSVLLHQMGAAKYFTEIPGLTHIGGMSGRYLQALDLNSQVNIDDTDLAQQSATQTSGFNIRNDFEKSLKKLYGKYFYCYLNHLIGKGAAPNLLTNNPRVMTTVNRLVKEIEQVVEMSKNHPETKAIWQLINAQA